MYIEMPAVVIASDTYDIAGKSDVTNRTFAITALGGRCKGVGSNDPVMPPFLMSDAAGAYIDP